MSIYKGDVENILTGTNAYCETVASQEETYLEETEEELRVILISKDSSSPQNYDCISAENRIDRKPDFEVKRSMIQTNRDIRTAQGFDDQLNHAAEELITGDSDDPPLSEDAVVELLRGVRSLGA
jgi:hypothetical protein